MEWTVKEENGEAIASVAQFEFTYQYEQWENVEVDIRAADDREQT